MGEEENSLKVWDEGDGISLELPISEGVTMKIYMDDEQAEDLISFIRNKLNARF